MTIGNNPSGVVTTAAEQTAGVDGSPGGRLVVDGMASGGTFELNGAINGASAINVTDATLGTSGSDVLNIRLNGAANIVNTALTTINGVETLNFTTTDSTSDANPTAASVVKIGDTAATTITVSGNHGIYFLDSVLSKVTSLDATGVVANPISPTNPTPTAAQIGAAGAVSFWASVTDKDVSFKGGNGNDDLRAFSITDATKIATISGGAGDDLIVGGAGKDVLSGGDGNDRIVGNSSADTMAGGAGNDFFGYNNKTDSVVAKEDAVSDFSANTWGYGTDGAANSKGANLSDPTKVTGDVIGLAGLFSGVVTGIATFVATNAADAQTFIQNTADAGNLTGIALDKSTGDLYIDLESNGTIDMVIELTGVTTVNTAAIYTGL